MDTSMRWLRDFGATALVIFGLLGFGWGEDAHARGGAVHVSGYTRANGTYVAPHYRSAPDGDFGNN